MHNVARMKRIALPLLVFMAGCGGSSGDTSITTTPTGSQLVIDDDDFEFDPTIPQTPTAATTFIITNQGHTRTGQLTAIVSGDDDYAFTITQDSCTSQVLVAGAMCRVAVALAASRIGAFEADLRVSGLPGGIAKAHVHGEVEDATLVISPIDFGGVPTGTTGPTLTVSITNASSVDSGALALSPFSSTEIAVVADKCTGVSLGSGQVCTLQLAYAPALGDSNPLADSLVVSAPSAGAVAQPITGSPILPAALSVDDYDFGSYGAHYGPFTTHAMTVTNSGSLTAKVGVVALANPTLSGFVITADHCTGVALAGGATCDVDVRSLSYNVTTSTAVALADTLTVKFQSGVTATAQISGSVSIDYITSSIGVSPSTDYGSVTSSDGQTADLSESTFFWPLHPTAAVTLTAQPKAGHIFNGWTQGICSSIGPNTCTFTPAPGIVLFAYFN